MADLSRVVALRQHPIVRQVVVIAQRVAPEVPLHLVGGMVRDAWLERSTHDLDLVVAGRGEEIAHRLAEALKARFVRLGGEELATFRLVGEGFELDLWDRRGMTVHQDLARRDLTVNAIALDLGAQVEAAGGKGAETEPIVDPFGGIADLERRRLRATTESSFSEDPLRVLRLPRFLSQIPGFRVEPATRDLARQAVPELARIAVERIREELRRLFEGDGAPQAFRELAALGIYPDLFLADQAFVEGFEPWQKGSDIGRVAERAAAEMELLPALAKRLEELVREVGLGRDVALDLAAVRWASAVVHLTDPELQDPASATSPTSRSPGSILLLQRDRGHLSRSQMEPVLALVGSPDPPPSGPQGEPERRQTLHRLGERWADALLWWGARAVLEPWEERVREILLLLRDEGDWIFDPPRLITGEEVQELLELPPGPEIGRLLDAVRQAQVAGRVRTRKQALALISGGAESRPAKQGQAIGRSRRTTSSRRP